eukprot:TRINITY_DN11860_c1_g2_i1.p1 TRINITY_DN11860_c1_g2~~TRINITY_DN11860_c1_g2_i1.p1  ORF type:complete len:435 (-),score=73.54 TRINITY_DN11860_c1_g2_i1:209-1513(-)
MWSCSCRHYASIRLNVAGLSCQALLLQESRLIQPEEILEGDFAPDTSSAPSTLERPFSPSLRLRSLRRNGPLSELDEHAYSVLMHGTLCEYNGAAPDLRMVAPSQFSATLSTLAAAVDPMISPSSQASLSARSHGAALETTSLTDRPLSSQSSHGEMSVSGLLQLALAGAEDSARAWSPSATHFSEGFWQTDRTILSEEGMSSPSITSPGFNSTLGGESLRTSQLNGLLRQLLVADSNSRAPADAGLPEEPSQGSQASSIAEDSGVESFRAESTAGSGGFWQTSRTILSQEGGELVREGGDGNDTFNLHGLLRQLVNEDALGQGLAATAQRMLQHGTVAGGQQLSMREIEALPKVRFSSENQTCAVCLEDYKERELLTALRCGHAFHTPCLTGWLRRSACCPLCRANQATPDPTEAAAEAAAEAGHPNSSSGAG